MRRALETSLVSIALSCSAAAFADEPPLVAAPPEGGAAAPAPTKPGRPATKKPELPVELTITATTPDPPWTLRIVNTSEAAIRIPADVRVLRFDLESQTSKGQKRKHACTVPVAMRGTSFPAARELYLRPGEAYEESFDPRLVCFGAAAEALREGTRVWPKFGWTGGAWQKGPWAAQGTDHPESFAPRREIRAEPLLLPAARSTPPDQMALAGPPGPKMEREGDPAGPDPVDERAPIVDRQAPQLDIYVERYEDAAVARDIVITIRAVNEGKRRLATVLRSRMLTFRVEELGPDGRARSVVSCEGQHHPHAIPREMMRDLGPSQEVRIPILLAEMCPRNATFRRPGLYRVTPRLDPTVEGEGEKVDPYVGEALAKQPALVRLATGPEPFYAEGPRPAGPQNAAPAKPEPADKKTEEGTPKAPPSR